jgi:hypothetical protein
MPDGNFVVVALTTRDAKVWTTGVAPGTKPETIKALDAHGEQRHVRAAQADHMHHRKFDDTVFFGAIADAIRDAASVLLIGHGKGKANAMLSFVQFLERRRPEIAQKVDGAVDHDLEAMTDGQVLAAARDWHDHHVSMS